MVKPSKTLHLMASKLCLSEEERVLSKAAEFERLLQMKSTTSTITDTAKVVICLDLAATIFRIEFDQRTAVKCSGLKTPTYMNSRKIIENVLELNAEQLTVSALCLTLQCNVQDLAERILDEFRKEAKMELDMNIPQYVCMAVYQACRVSKIKVSKSKLIDKSQLKSAQWTKLDAEWTKFTDDKFAAVIKKKRGKLAKNAAIDEEEKMEVDEEVIINKKEEPTEPQIEAYDDWKRRILEKAYKELEKQSLNTHKNTPSKLNDTANRQSARNKQKDTPNKQKDTPNKQKDTPNKQKETPNKQNETPNKQNETPNKQKETPNKQKETPNKQKETINKQKETPNKQKETIIKHKETPTTQKDALILNGLNENSNKDFGIKFSPRKSPRKTPQKFEPYKSPVKNKGVRLLFPV